MRERSAVEELSGNRRDRIRWISRDK